MAPTLSILVPTYNRSALLRKALVSILAQSYTDYEVIVVDNCSPDDTAAIVAALADPRIRYYQNARNIGPINNHNRALRLAAGRYVCTFSDDDVMLPNNLAAKVAVLDQHPQVGVVHSQIHTINETDAVISTEQWGRGARAGERLSGPELMAAQEAYELLYEGWNFICMPSVMLRKSVLDAQQLEFNNQLGYLVDWDLWLKIARHADFYYLKIPLILYRTHSTNESAQMNSEIYFKELFLIKVSLLAATDQTQGVQQKIKQLAANIEAQMARANALFHPETVAPPPLWHKVWRYVPLKTQIKQMLGRG